MSKVTSIICVGAGLVLAAGIVFAAKPVTSQNTQTFCLYKTASTSSQCIQKLTPTDTFRSFYKEGNMYKVGLSKTGQVGWVNTQQYQQAVTQYEQPNIQTVYINVDKNGKAKSTVNIVAYKNGEKMTDVQAKNIYQKLRQQQRQQYVALQRFNRSMDHMFNQEMIFSKNVFDNTWRDPFFSRIDQLPPMQSNQRG